MTNLSLKRFILKSLSLDNYKTDYRLTFNFPKYLNDTLIGLLLSDGGLEKSSETSNVRLNVTMSITNFPYILHLYNLFEPYIDNNVNIINVDLKNKEGLIKTYTTVRFKTVSMPHLLYYFNIFYKRKVGSYIFKKIVPVELKSNFSALEKNIIRIFTNSFIKEDVIFLSNIIMENLNIENKVIYDRKNQYIIKIEKDNINKLRNIILPYMHPSMLYKLGINDLILNKEEVKFDYYNIISDI